MNIFFLLSLNCLFLIVGWSKILCLEHSSFIKAVLYLSSQFFIPLNTTQDVRRGMKTVKYICKEYDIRGVFGPIIELLDCDERFFTAVEVTAGNRYLQFCLFLHFFFFFGEACYCNIY
jgi:hypothetical protein